MSEGKVQWNVKWLDLSSSFAMKSNMDTNTARTMAIAHVSKRGEPTSEQQALRCPASGTKTCPAPSPLSTTALKLSCLNITVHFHSTDCARFSFVSIVI
ncbi:hypothetical protein AWZ03_001644 [Drosophila navojoa]|uniref:Uncharacterized protein n=1 Tax=Drosophila navojoa TaxID=7232 RepID=A0A484BTI8_DRONA|nr:hypothetical protein AWZ03_001644 [Drosophila navojoa]